MKILESRLNGIWLERRNIAKLMFFVAGYFAFTNVVFAQDAAALTGEIATTISTYMTLAIQVLSALVLVVVGWGVISKFMSALQGRAEWGEIFMPIAIGVVIIAVTTFLFTQAADLAGQITGA